MKIITVSREFGSGGRELGKRLADAFGFSYYDKEIITEIAKKTELDENYVSSVVENGVSAFPVHIGQTFAYIPYTYQPSVDVLVAQQKIITEIGKKGNCVIIGRSANSILDKFSPFNIFVYASEKSKLARCRQNARESEILSDKELIRKMRGIDRNRLRTSALISERKWGDKASYDLMINTSDVEIKSIIQPLKEYIEKYFENFPEK